jgi:exosome complex component RRP42
MDKFYTTPDINAERIKNFLKEGKRFDGRKPDQFRDIVVEMGVSSKAEGSVRVKIGKTEVIVGVKMDTSTPYGDSPDKGNLMTTAELLPLSSSRFEIGRPGFPSIELGRVIDRGLRESGFIDFKKLCIKEGEKVWTVFVDIYSINDDGNLLDAAGLGAIIALKNAFVPKYDAENDKVLYGELSDQKFPTTDILPLSLTAYKLGDTMVVDPTREEEDVLDTRITIGISNGIISSMQKGDSHELSVEQMNDALDLIEKTEKEILKTIGEYVK